MSEFCLEKHKSGYSVLIGTVRNSREWVKIYKSVFREEARQRQRFFALIKAFRQGILLANNIFISVEDNGKMRELNEKPYS